MYKTYPLDLQWVSLFRRLLNEKKNDHLKKKSFFLAKPVVSAFLDCIRSLASDQIRNVAVSVTRVL